MVLLVIGGHLLGWTLLTGLAHSSPNPDNMEELVWGSFLEWGYFKHPPLPSWLLFALTQVFGRQVWVTFFAGQLSVALALFFIWRLGCEMTTRKNALVGVLLMMPIAYFTTRGIMSNHNTIQLWSVAGMLWMFYRAWRYERMLDWLLLGVLAGCAMLTKYSALVHFAAFALFLLATGSLRRARTWRGIALATVVLAAMLAPHVWWLLHAPKNPVDYASASIGPAMTRGEHWHMMGHTLGTTLTRLAPMLLGWLLVAAWGRMARRQGGDAGSEAETATLAFQLRREDRFFILFVGLAPLLLTSALVLIFKARLIADWATTFYLLFGFLGFWVFSVPKGDSTRLLVRCMIVILTIQAFTAIGYAAVRGPIPNMLGRSTRSTFPGGDVSRLLQQEWRAHVDAPLLLVASDVWLGGNIAIHAGRRTQVLIDGDVEKSQWVAPGQVKRCGMLVAIDHGVDAPRGIPADVEPRLVEWLDQARWTGMLETPATGNPTGPVVRIAWGIIPPTADCREPN